MKVIIPCAGYGTRLDTKPNESKEMLWDNQRQERIIDYSLRLCRDLELEPLVLTRTGKDDLNNYLRSNKVPMYYSDYGTEWYDTILQAHEVWEDNNMVLLPDTRWDNALQSLKHIKYCFEKLNSVMALGTLEVEDARKWCVLHGDFLFEKPSSTMCSLGVGVFAFHKEIGKRMFEAFKNKESFEIPKSTQFVELENFKDITREKSNRLTKI